MGNAAGARSLYGCRDCRGEMNVTTEGAIAFAVGLLMTAALLAGWLPLARRMGWTVRDRYKPGTHEVVGWGGLVVFMGWLITLILFFEGYRFGDTECYWRVSTYEILLIFTALACAAMGLMDDNWKIPQFVKALLPLLLALPLVLYLSDRPYPDPWPAYASGWPALFVLVATLIYVSLGTNLTNMHAGFNGLAPGNALIMLFAVAIVAESHIRSFNPPPVESLLVPDYHITDVNLPLLALAGATAALLLFNRYPARVLEGNVGSHLWGGAIAAALLIEGLWLEGLVLFAPQLVDFGLWGYARARRYPFQKYAPLIDGEIRPDDLFKLKFLVAHRFPREWQAVLVLWGMQLVAAVAFVALAGGF